MKRASLRSSAIVVAAIVAASCGWQGPRSDGPRGEAASAMWVEQSAFDNSVAAAGDFFGVSVAVSGDTAVVGAPGAPTSKGKAFVFVRAGTTWSLQATLTASTGVAGDDFGRAVAVSGDTAIVGAPGRSVGGMVKEGAAYVFVRSGGSWAQAALLTPGDGTSGDNFGDAVALDQGTAVVGSPNHVVQQKPAGAAYVFVGAGAAWTQQARLTSSDPAPSDWFGMAVAVSGDTAVVGAPQKQQYTGAAYVFTRAGATWSEQAKLVDANPAVNEALGLSVAVDLDTIVLPARSQGAFVFARSGGAWSQQAQLLVGDAQHAALSGDVAVVANAYYASSLGTAYAFVRTGSAWSTTPEQVIASDGAPNDSFGQAVAMSGDTVVVGAYTKSANQMMYQGAAYAFTFQAPPCPDAGAGGACGTSSSSSATSASSASSATSATSASSTSSATSGAMGGAGGSGGASSSSSSTTTSSSTSTSSSTTTSSSTSTTSGSTGGAGGLGGEGGAPGETRDLSCRAGSSPASGTAHAWLTVLALLALRRRARRAHPSSKRG